MGAVDMKHAAALIEAVKVLLTAGIAWVVIMGWWPMTAEQQAATLSFAVAALGVIGVWATNTQTTSVNDPKDTDGARLMRSDGTAPLRSSQRND